MDIDIFDDVEMEFFKLSEELPKGGENVVVLVKPGYFLHAGYGTTPAAYTTNVIMDYCVYCPYKSVPNKFKGMDWHKRVYLENELLGWARVKGQFKY